MEHPSDETKQVLSYLYPMYRDNGKGEAEAKSCISQSTRNDPNRLGVDHRSQSNQTDRAHDKQSSLRLIRRTADHHLHRFLRCAGIKLDATLRHVDSNSAKLPANDISDNKIGEASTREMTESRTNRSSDIERNVEKRKGMKKIHQPKEDKSSADHFYDKYLLQQRSNDLPSFGIDALQTYRSLSSSVVIKPERRQANEVTRSNNTGLTYSREKNIPLNVDDWDRASPSQMISQRIKELEWGTLGGSVNTQNEFVSQCSIAPLLETPPMSEVVRKRYSEIPSPSSLLHNEQPQFEQLMFSQHPPVTNNKDISWSVLTQQLQGNPTEYRLLYNPETQDFEGIVSADALRKLVVDGSTPTDQVTTGINPKQNSRNVSSAIPKYNNVDVSAHSASGVQWARSRNGTVAVGGIRGIALHRGPPKKSEDSSYPISHRNANDIEIAVVSSGNSTGRSAVSKASSTFRPATNVPTSSILHRNAETRVDHQSLFNGTPTHERRTDCQSDQCRLKNQWGDQQQEIPFPHPLGVESQEPSNRMVISDHHRNSSTPSLHEQELPVFPSDGYHNCSHRARKTKSKRRRNNDPHSSYRIRGLKPFMVDGFPDSQAAGDILWHSTGAAGSPGINSIISREPSAAYPCNQSVSSFRGYRSVDPLMQLRNPYGAFSHLRQPYPYDGMWNAPNYSPACYEFQCQAPYGGWSSSGKEFDDMESPVFYAHRKFVPKCSRRLRADNLCFCVD